MAVTPDVRKRPDRTRRLLVLALPTAVASVFALWRLGELPFWRDEVATIVSCNRSLAGTLAVLWHREANMTLYYLFMNGWLRLGHGELWARLPSAVFGIAAVPITVLLARRAFDDSLAVIAGLLLATNSLLMWYAHQARSYALVVLLAALSGLLLVRAVDRGGSARWAGFVAAATAMVYCQSLAVLVVLAQVGSLLVLWPSLGRTRRTVGWSAAAWALLVSPAVAYAVLAGHGQIDWLKRPDWPALVQTAGAFFNSPVLGAGLGLLIVVVAVQTVALARQEGRSRAVWLRGFVLAWAGAPPAVTFVASQVRPVFLDRFLIGALPAALIAAALGITALRKRAVVAVVTGAIVLYGGFGLVTQSRPAWLHGPGHGPQKEDLRAGAAFVARHQLPGDALAYRSAEERLGFAYYYRRAAGPRPLPDLGLAGGARPDAILDIYPPDSPPGEVRARARMHRRVWLVGSREIPTCCHRTAAGARLVYAEFAKRTHFRVGDVWVVLLQGNDATPLPQGRLSARPATRRGRPR